MNVWVRNAYNRKIDIQNESTFVFQLRGHPWSIVYKPYVRSMQIDTTQEDARSISESLGTSAIYYAGSDTCGTLEYHLFSNGVYLVHNVHNIYPAMFSRCLCFSQRYLKCF